MAKVLEYMVALVPDENRRAIRLRLEGVDEPVTLRFSSSELASAIGMLATGNAHLGKTRAGNPKLVVAPTSDVALADAFEAFDAMELERPPPFRIEEGGPIAMDAPRPGEVALAPVGKAYNDNCTGGDSYENNCAHFLSDAFIRGGYTELANNNPHVNARCGKAKRPIRARDMWSWFKAKATTTSEKVERNTGWWAVFQLDETVYWGGHVALINTDTWRWYGTGWYGSWHQYAYQW